MGNKANKPISVLKQGDGARGRGKGTMSRNASRYTMKRNSGSDDELPPSPEKRGASDGDSKNEYANLGDFDRDYSRAPRTRKRKSAPRMDPELASFAESLKKKEGHTRSRLGGSRTRATPKKKKNHIIMGNVQQLPGTVFANATDSPGGMSANSGESDRMQLSSLQSPGSMRTAAAALEQPASKGFAYGGGRVNNNIRRMGR